jgi:hypothetical protein
MKPLTDPPTGDEPTPKPPPTNGGDDFPDDGCNCPVCAQERAEGWP